MQRYIEQLIEDLRNATLLAPADPYDDENLDDDEALEKELEEVEHFTSGPLEILSDILGIQKNLLPHPNRLQEKDVEKIIPEMIALMHAYNFHPEYPEQVPAGMLYAAIYNIWDDEFVRMSFGTVHIEFCDYNEENCPFPGFCHLCEESNKLINQIPKNEYLINASQLKGDKAKIDEDFQQIENEYYGNPEHTDKEGFIEGIYNYCDRWCERCDFTDQCHVFAMESELRKIADKSKEGDESDIEIDLDALADTLDLNDPDLELDFPNIINESFDEDEDEDANNIFSSEYKTDHHPLIELATKYSIDSFDWLIEREKELEVGFMAQLAQGYADEVLEAEDVMAWYQTFIVAKLKRATSGYFELDEFEEAEYDMNGSAKVALIGLDRSIEAATILMRHLKSHRSKIRVFKNQLENLRLMAEELFPDARMFVRPGLDEI